MTWVLAFFKGRKLSELLFLLVRLGDNVIASGFGLVDGMPWVESVDVKEILGTPGALRLYMHIP